MTLQTGPSPLRNFAIEIEKQLESDAIRDGNSTDEALMQMYVLQLQEVGQCPDLTWVDLNVTGSKGQPGMTVHGWGIDTDRRLHLAGILSPKQAVQDENLPYVFGRKEVSDTFGKLVNTVSYLKDGKFLADEKHHRIAEMATQCRDLLAELDPEVVLHLFTTGHVKGGFASHNLSGVLLSSYVHDIEWLQKQQQDDPTDQLDLRDQPGGGLPCLVATRFPDGDPQVILTVLPGELLADLYDRRRDELLRRNVRIYLRSKMKVNRDMAASVRATPGLFIALNNGISAVANSASFSSDFSHMETLNDLQIVNGGQTTATIHEVWKDRNKKADISQLRVQAKITIIRGENGAEDELAEQLAISANSQSKVTASDLLSSDPYERSLESISRARRYPTGSVETGWFYERVRGQHAGALAFDARQEKVYPRDQVIDKSKAAQLLLAWRGLPHLASLGGEKALKAFKDDLKKDTQIEEAGGKVSEQYFDTLVGLAVIRREAEGPIAAEISMKPPLGHYLLAWLAEHRASSINLQQVARTGVLSNELLHTIQKVTPLISKVMRAHPESVPHESERPKRAGCWEEVKKIVLPEVQPVLPGATRSWTRDYSRQDWQAAKRWVQGTRNAQLRDRIINACRIVETGKGKAKKALLDAVMKDAIAKGFKPDLGAVQIGDPVSEVS
ncbi:AIPR family protein [Deinococcus aquiradiocola]|uniref:Abortive phage infection protein C-terminal domain-containing protein n=1 Tax=Deinococcus aquiradiocola TaxID=393059 RepID=A0A917UNU6_9DEIO|nr:AIPR family protein [Deinococcus aquiradiocola]GGJ71350.1 hypothetical protein GCM10008939_14650 [Deinococcus aquiradiocola]